MSGAILPQTLTKRNLALLAKKGGPQHSSSLFSLTRNGEFWPRGLSYWSSWCSSTPRLSCCGPALLLWACSSCADLLFFCGPALLLRTYLSSAGLLRASHYPFSCPREALHLKRQSEALNLSPPKPASQEWSTGKLWSAGKPAFQDSQPHDMVHR